MLRRWNPFRGLSNPREVWAWGMYDLANQSFTLLIITLLFPIYFSQVVVEGDKSRGESLWSIAGSASLLLVVLLSPIVGAAADARGVKKRLLVSTGVVCAALTCALGFVGPGDWLFAVALFMGANVCYQFGENFLASFLPEIATPRNIGRVSATGWTMGYVGALLLLILTAVMMNVFGWGPVERWSPLFVFAGVWFLIAMVPSVVVLREAPPAPADPGGAAPLHAPAALVAEAFGRLRATARSARTYTHLARLLGAFFVYAFGIQTVIYFAGILAHDFGFDQTSLVLFVLQLTITAGIGAALTAVIQDRIGARTTIALFLGVWIVTSVSLALLTIPANPAPWLLWVVGNGIGLGLGGAGTATRALVGRFTPRHKTAEFFGLWGMVYKGSGVVGVLTFGQVRALVGGTASFALLTCFFVVGLLLLMRVDERAGLRAAQRAERAVNGARRTLSP